MVDHNEQAVEIICMTNVFIDKDARLPMNKEALSTFTNSMGE